MSKSVTVICGAVWTRRSITAVRNIMSKPMAAVESESIADAGHGSGTEVNYKGRNFRRHVRTIIKP